MIEKSADPEYTNLNTKIELEKYMKFKIICIEEKIKIYEGINNALSFYIENRDKK